MIHTVCNTVLKTTAICYDYNFCEKNSKFILKQPHTVHMVVLRRCVKGSVPIFSICLINTEKAGGRERDVHLHKHTYHYQQNLVSLIRN